MLPYIPYMDPMGIEPSAKANLARWSDDLVAKMRKRKSAKGRGGTRGVVSMFVFSAKSRSSPIQIIPNTPDF